MSFKPVRENVVSELLLDPQKHDMFLSGRPRPIVNARMFKYKLALKKCQNCCALCGVLVCILLLMLSLFAIAFRPTQDIINVVLIDSEKLPVHVTSDKFLSVTLDSSLIAEGFLGFNMTDQRIMTLLSALAPGYLRIGGTSSDRLYFSADRTLPSFKTITTFDRDGKTCGYGEAVCKKFLYPNFTMSADEWESLNKLAARTDFQILFDLNALVRFDNGSWDPSNARTLINYTRRNIRKNVLWQLGNEPNLFRDMFDYDVNATQLAKDFLLLRSILKNGTRLVGPDTTRPLSGHKHAPEVYLTEFLQNGAEAVDAVTFHHYYFNGRTANVSDFIDPDVFDSLKLQIADVKRIVKETTGSHDVVHIWLTETSSAYHGGAPGISNRYLATFIWLDKLGVAAQNGINAVMRQSFYKGYYALIDNTYEPTPDWWVSLLYKRLVGPQVVHCYKLMLRRVRMYCHCGRSGDGVPYVTVFGMNVQDREAKVRIQLTKTGRDSYPKNIFAYVLTSEYSMYSKRIRLNDQILALERDGSVPHLKPTVVYADPYITLPPTSLVFWVFPAPLGYCLQ